MASIAEHCRETDTRSREYSVVETRVHRQQEEDCFQVIISTIPRAGMYHRAAAVEKIRRDGQIQDGGCAMRKGTRSKCTQFNKERSLWGGAGATRQAVTTEI